MLLSLFAIAAIGEAAEPPVEPSGVDPLDEGWRRLHRGDAEGARLVAASVLRADPTRQADARYLLGASAELARRWDEAAALYQGVVDDFAGTDRARDARFRLALVLADAGRPAEARRALRPLRVGASEDDRLRLGLVDAELRVAEGRPRAIELAHARLDEVDDDRLPWFEARVRLAIVRAEVAEAGSLSVDGAGRRLKASLVDRAALLRRAEEEGSPLVALAEPRFAVAGLLELGRGLEALADDLLAAPVPPELTPAQRDHYVAVLRERVAPIHVRAWQVYDLGVETVGHLGWTGPEADALREALARVGARVEAP